MRRGDNVSPTYSFLCYLRPFSLLGAWVRRAYVNILLNPSTFECYHQRNVWTGYNGVLGMAKKEVLVARAT